MIGDMPPPGRMNVIWPALKCCFSPVRNLISASPSSTSSLKPPEDVVVTTIVVPSTEAVAEPVWIVPPPLPLGE